MVCDGFYHASKFAFRQYSDMFAIMMITTVPVSMPTPALAPMSMTISTTREVQQSVDVIIVSISHLQAPYVFSAARPRRCQRY
jgi:hypothetical protein